MHFSSLKLLKHNNGIKLSLSSPLVVLKWSLRETETFLFLGCVSEPYTIDLNTGIPIINGLFCERIFGPLLSWKCNCGLFNSSVIIEKSYICPLCFSESTNSLVRRYRFGYLYLNSPVCHTSYLKNNIISLFSNIAQYELLKLIYFDFSSIDSFYNKYTLSQLLFSSNYILHKLSKLNLVNKIISVRNILNISKIYSKKEKYTKYIHLLNLFLLNNISPEWLLLTVLPIIPAGLRPLIRLNCNTFSLSNINEIYRNIIIKNNRIRKLKKFRKRAFLNLEILEKRNLQQSIDALLTNNKGSVKKPILKLSSNYFKQYLLGKRVDFSGRSVITSGPTLPYLHIGLPFKFGLKLFEQHLFKILKKNKIIKTILFLAYTSGKYNLILKRLLNYIFYNQVLLINRAPTLHRMNIQAFKPHLLEGTAIKLFPLTCSSFNADFDGDQMGVFILTSESANKESKHHIITDKNLLHPYLFKNVFKCTQTIVLGLNILLSLKYKERNQYIFNSVNEILNHYCHNLVDLNSLIILKICNINDQNLTIVKKYIFTSVGKILLRILL